MIGHFVGQEPMPGYAVFRAQLGLTVTTLASATDPEAADRVLAQVTEEAIKAGDGYAARDVLRYRSTQAGLSGVQGKALSDLLTSSGLGSETLPEPLLHSLLNSTQAATEVLGASIPQPGHPAMRA